MQKPYFTEVIVNIAITNLIFPCKLIIDFNIHSYANNLL